MVVDVDLNDSADLEEVNSDLMDMGEDDLMIDEDPDLSNLA